ncbi:MAG: hypothetical protein V4510_04905 [bacterium]
MAKKVYPAWQYYAAAAIALFFGIGLLAQQSFVYGGVFTAVGLVFAAFGIANGRKAKRPVNR